jgi:hypothetical protein
MKDNDDTLLIVAVAAVGFYFLVMKPKTTVPATGVTSIVPIGTGSTSAATTAAVTAVAPGLFSTIANLFKPGSTPSQSNVVPDNTTTTSAGQTTSVAITNTGVTPILPSSDPFANLQPVNTAPVNIAAYSNGTSADIASNPLNDDEFDEDVT